MATHSGSLAWRIPWTEEPGGRLFGTWGRTELDTAEQLSTAQVWAAQPSGTRDSYQESL